MKRMFDYNRVPRETCVEPQVFSHCLAFSDNFYINEGRDLNCYVVSHYRISASVAFRIPSLFVFIGDEYSMICRESSSHAYLLS
jgi:hypothetical protein